jgi:hypothetical protein
MKHSNFIFNSHKNRERETTPWSEFESELYRPSHRRLSAKRLPTFADKGCYVVSVADPFGRILGFLDRSRYFEREREGKMKMEYSKPEYSQSLMSNQETQGQASVTERESQKNRPHYLNIFPLIHIVVW